MVLSVRELKGLVRELDAQTFATQLGPFVLVQRPFVKDDDHSLGGPKITRPIRQRKRTSVFDFDESWVATLPPMAKHDSFTLGRSPDCDLVIDEGTVSKHHARIEWHENHAILVDLGSSNGTWVNGSKLEGSTMLKDNDAIDFGGVQVCFLVVATLREKLAPAL